VSSKTLEKGAQNEKSSAIDSNRNARFVRPGVERDEVGIPLDDLLIAGPGESLMMSMKGEETLRDINAPLVEDFEEVDTLFRMSV